VTAPALCDALHEAHVHTRNLPVRRPDRVAPVDTTPSRKDAMKNILHTVFACTAAIVTCTAAATPAATPLTPQLVVFAKQAGQRHASDLAARGLDTNYVNCGIRAHMEIAASYTRLATPDRAVFLDAFDSTCVGGGDAAAAMGGPQAR
jgi:hypothetical protein